MPRYIDADALKDVIQQHDYPLADRLNSIDNGMFTLGIFQAIDEQPTLSPDDVRGVVRCKDCKFGEHDTDGNGDHCVLCGNSMVFDYPYAHDPNWFCADGEMKGAEDKS